LEQVEWLSMVAAKGEVMSRHAKMKRSAGEKSAETAGGWWWWL
jgi:hypothetical protein